VKKRLDQLIVERGLADSREKAQALIIAGAVMVNGQKAAKPGHSLPDDARIDVTQKLPFVGRGGLKMERALEHFAIDVTGKICLDVGSSTGGFTDCLLQHGAERVYAVDAGTGQLDWKLRSDPRVVVHENVNARYLDRTVVPEPIDFACFDVSFISVTMVLQPAVALLKPKAGIVILIKPQFEVGRGEVGKGGIVRDPALHEAACATVAAAVHQLGGFHGSFHGIGGGAPDIIESPVLGAEGNREFLLYARR
jgi:23S rRNA (cytidine1920-2'-O)/16S rRNA (cytidine1409-2'-O)-methyltransferase